MENRSTKILIAIGIVLVVVNGVLFAIKVIREKNDGSNEVISLGTEILGQEKKEDNKENNKQ